MTPRKKLREKIKKELPSIVNKIQSGDKQSREDFAALLLPYLKTVLYKYRRTIDDEVESLAGFVITKLLNNISSIDTTKPILSYIDVTAVNQAIDQHRKYTRNKSNDTTEYQPYREYDLFYELSGMSSCSKEQALEALKLNLDDSQAEVISMYYLDSMSYQDIASHTGIDPKQIEKTIQYARENFSRAVGLQALSEQGSDYPN